ncbi:hypothetical protein F5148DRAFT_1310037, partial [Russula earlei]
MATLSRIPFDSSVYVEADKATGGKAGIADLIAQYGSSPATSWLESGRYKIWHPDDPIPQSSFPPFKAISDPILMFCMGQVEQVLGAQGSQFGWSTLSCIVEDFLDPRSVVELAHSHGGGSEVKDFKKNLRRAEREDVQVREVQPDQWTDTMRRQVEQGIASWKKSKSGIQIASVSLCRPL